MKLRSLLFLLAASLFLFSPAVQAASFKTTSKTIYTFPASVASDLVPMTPNFSIVGDQFICNRLAAKWVPSLIYNGKEINDHFKYMYIEPKFSPDGKNYVYFVSYDDNRKNASNYHVVLNGKEYFNYKNVSGANFVFSGNSKHNAFPATDTDNGKMFIVYDRKEQTKYDFVSAPSLSPDGKTLAYAANNKKYKKKILIINNKVIGSYEDVKAPVVFSPNSKHLAYAVKDGNWSIYVDNKKVASGYDNVDNILVDNSAKYAFIGRKGNSYAANINGKESAKYPDVSNLVISPDGKQSAFIARNSSNSETAVVNGKEGVSYPIFMGVPVFSPDSKHLAYKTSRFTSDGKSRIFLFIIDGKEMTANGWYYNAFYQSSGMYSEFTFSADSHYLFYYSKVDNKIVKNTVSL